MGDETASRATGVRLKKVRGSRLRCVVNRTDGHSLFFSFWPSETFREPRVLIEKLFTVNCKTLSLSARINPLIVFGFVLAMKV